jgi:GH24 family phage-related lysozyme (muramidase)
MHNSVRLAFPKFTERFEGRVPWMYQDIKGLITTGLGCLIDGVVEAQALPWQRDSDNNPASAKEIALEWLRIKHAHGIASKGANASRAFSTLHLNGADIDRLALKRLDQHERYLKLIFPEIEHWPADAQLGLFSMSWAMGPGFVVHFPKFTDACKRQDWISTANECIMNATKNPGLVPRNKANVKLYTSASTSTSIETLRGWP